MLIADDDRTTAQVLAGLLVGAGYKTTIALDATQALMMAMRDVPDAVVLDIGMPGGGGIGVLQRLKASSKTMQIPVVIVTALTDPDLPARVRGLGADAFLTKPVAADQLKSALTRVLDASQDGGTAS